MYKLRLTDITKTYRNGENVQALKGVSLEFRQNEFVSILGQSGCGKTTLLNIIGGLDHYDTGNLEIDGLSTKNFKDKDWDAYRNNTIGFVFQNYNLIGHQTILENVEIAMTLSGVSSSERRSRAIEALESVGLGNKLKKKPNQLSGGQMQRVSIARALVNNPDIILADEPTGALDSHTSIQVMDILKEISKTKLVIMVTHNAELAKEYSSRLIKIKDGEVQEDSNPLFRDKNAEVPIMNKKFKKTSMSPFAAAKLSFKNLMTKKGRTFLTAFAGSIGIIGIALVLALSGGLTSYMSKLEEDSLSGLPITVTQQPQTLHTMGHGDGESILSSSDDKEGAYTKDNVLYSYDSSADIVVHSNILTKDYFDYIANIEKKIPEAVNAVTYQSGVEINVLAKGGDSVVKYETTADESESSFHGNSNIYWQEMHDDEEFILSQYDLIGEGSRLPSDKNEIALVVDKYNKIDQEFFEKLGMNVNVSDYKLTDFIGKTILKVIPNNMYYTKSADGLFKTPSVSDYASLYDNFESLGLTITGILRPKEDTGTVVEYLSSGIVYTPALTEYVLDNASKSEIAKAQKDSESNVILNTIFNNEDEKNDALVTLGANTTPIGISIYPASYEGKDKITDYLDNYNKGKEEKNQIVYNDMAATIESVFGETLGTVTTILAGFAAISLVVSTIMIAIITYVSVLERTKEIGILRSVGARKKDISRVFNAEAVIIGMTAGLLGIGISYLLCIPINITIKSMFGINKIANLNIVYAVILVLGSMFLTMIAGFVPAKMAAKKDPVEALRSE